MKMPPKKTGSPDDFYTPTYAITPLLKYIPEGSRIWECCNGGGNMSSVFELNGFDVLKTDIKEGIDFLKEERNDFDLIITNPPFSLKDKFLEKCYRINKPFALLLPLTALEGKFRQSLYKKYGIQVILFNKRINYQNHIGVNGCWFASAWFCYKMNLPNELNFVEIK